MQQELRTLPDRQIVYVMRTDLSLANIGSAAHDAWTTLHATLAEHDFAGALGAYCTFMPDFMRLPPKDQRYLACRIVGEDETPPADLGLSTGVLPGGRMAVFLHKGPYSGAAAAWEKVIDELLPAMGLAMAASGPFEVYLDDDAVTPPEELRTEICIPVE